MKDWRGPQIALVGLFSFLVVCVTLFNSQAIHKEHESRLHDAGMPWPPLQDAKFTFYARDIGRGWDWGFLSRDGDGTVWLLLAKPGTPILARIDAISPTSAKMSIPIPSTVRVSRMAWNASNTAWLWDEWGDRLMRLDHHRQIQLVTLDSAPGPKFALAVAQNGDAWFTKVVWEGPYHDYHTTIGKLDAKGSVSFTDLPVRAHEAVFDAKGDFWFEYESHTRFWPFDPRIWAMDTDGGVGVERVDGTITYFPSGRYVMDTESARGAMVRSPQGAIWVLSRCNVIGHVWDKPRLDITELPRGACPVGLAADNRNGVWFADDGEAGGPKTIGHMDVRGHLELFRAPNLAQLGYIAVDRDGDVWINGRPRSGVCCLRLAKFVPPAALRYRLQSSLK
jgi:streptogramin lyase